MAAFKHNIRDDWLARHLGQEKPKSMAALTILMTHFCVGEDCWSPYHHPAIRLTDHHVVGTKRQLKPNTGPPYLTVRAEIKQLGDIHTTFGRPWTIKQDIQDRSMDRANLPQGTTMATYSDVTNLTTPGPNAADGLHQSYTAMRPDIAVCGRVKR